MTTASISKQAQRDAALRSRKALSAHQRITYSQTILNSLQLYLENQNPQTDCLLTYHALPSEVNVNALFQQSVFHVYAPVTHHHEHMEWHKVSSTTQWETGCFGIMEPDAGDLWSADEGRSTLICPLAAFDRRGNRLGMGKGCFDYWLKRNRQFVRQVIGLAFSCQEVASIPVERHDMPMDCIITEKELFECQSS
jgi:5-formyltetrahydrofolate cyclo-ligase